MISKFVDKRLVVFVGNEGAFVFFSRSRLLKFSTSFVDGCNRAEFTDGRVDTEILAGSKSEMFQILDRIISVRFVWNGWRKVDSSKFIDELSKLRVSSRAIEYLILLEIIVVEPRKTYLCRIFILDFFFFDGCANSQLIHKCQRSSRVNTFQTTLRTRILTIALIII